MNLPPEFYTGPPVDAADLRYREEFLADLWEALESQHVLLTAPRRTGKTSVMDYLRENPKNAFTVIYENVQDLAHPADFFASLLARFYDEEPKVLRDLFQRSKGVVKATLEKVEKFEISEFKVLLKKSDANWSDSWKQHGGHFLEQVRKSSRRILLIVDELPDMILNMQKEHPELVQPFMSWFRTQRQSPKPKQDQVRWLIGGSVNLSSTLDALGHVDLINDFLDIPLPVLTDDQVKHFVETMLKSRDVEIASTVPAHVSRMLGRPIPLFMQMITQDLYRTYKKKPRKLTKNDVESAFSELVMSNGARDKLQHYYSRIGQYYLGTKAAAAHALLSQLSLSASGIGKKQLLQEYERLGADQQLPLLPHERKQAFNQLLRDLENDFYVTEIETDRYDFSSGLLKTWWKKYYA
jgi:hypothetical protein